jgi:hypothetical protein
VQKREEGGIGNMSCAQTALQISETSEEYIFVVVVVVVLFC